jgi:hypothetical protein
MPGIVDGTFFFPLISDQIGLLCKDMGADG